MKGLFIPEITAEMFRNGCLESIEALMAEGGIYDIEYDPEQKTGGWVLCSERLPESSRVWRTEYLATVFCAQWKEKTKTMCVEWENITVSGKAISRWIWNNRLFPKECEIIAWMPLPKPMKVGGEDEG